LKWERRCATCCRSEPHFIPIGHYALGVGALEIDGDADGEIVEVGALEGVLLSLGAALDLLTNARSTLVIVASIDVDGDIDGEAANAEWTHR